jgi:hypothetical protein
VAGQEWRSYLDRLMPLGEKMASLMLQPGDSHLRRELYRGIFSQLAAGHLALLLADPQHPDFWPFVTPAFTFAGGNPDHDYYVTPVEDAGVYRITGFRGTVKRVDIQIGTGTFFTHGTLDANKLGLTLANYDFDTLTIGPDGALEVIISRERPVGYTGDWWLLRPGATYLLLRQTSHDWINEVDGRFAIERLDRAAAKPRPTEAQLEAALHGLAAWTEGTVGLSLVFAREIRREQGVNRVAYKDLTEYGEMVTQKYAYGGFQLAPDEALIVEADIPERVRYWSIHLMDDQAFTLDWVHRQTILNGHSAVVDADGRFRCVISAQDPGVPNWLDTLGYASGLIQARWEECSHWPEHKVQLVKLDQVRRHLAPDTGTVTLQQREESIRARRRGAQMRKRW